MKLKYLFYIICPVISFFSCDEEDIVYSPKPRGYCRIDFPAKIYHPFDSACPYKFEIPEYSKITKPQGSEACWYNINYPRFNANIHLSYKPVNNDLARHIENSHYFASKHQVKASGVEETVIVRDSAKVYGLLFDISGNAASNLQFYLTDSTHHFLRGSLYFNSVPNIDSLKIVIDFIRQDMLHLIQTTEWKKH
ncbi:MAG: gldD [Bacteroidetes bacterium]|jgi:gliding motility-associated lipoprotein GldD|nr:gldD [Bacteroidota bacterium]